MGQANHMQHVVSAEEAVSLVKSGDRIYLHEAAMTPTLLLEALVARAEDLRGVTIESLHIEGPAPHVAPGLEESFRHVALFVGDNVREAVNDGRADYVPVFLSAIPQMVRHGALRPNVALLQVSPPDRHGFVRLGTSIACARSAADTADVVIGLVNPQVPRTMGNSAVHVSRFAALVEHDVPLPTHRPVVPDDISRTIGEHVAELVQDQATLQLGIGQIPDATLACLGSREGLGIHTEMFTDGVVDLIASGAVTNRNKSIFAGRVVTSFAVGSQRLYDFVDDNPMVEFHQSDIVNDIREISRIRRMTAINSAIEIDITGQVVADSIGGRIHSGIGGQMDFVVGATMAPEGRSIIALPSTARGGQHSRIVPEVKAGAGIVTTRGHVQWIVTEYGSVNLLGKSLRQRADLLCSVAHPDFRSDLRSAMVARHWSTPAASSASHPADA